MTPRGDGLGWWPTVRLVRPSSPGLFVAALYAPVLVLSMVTYGWSLVPLLLVILGTVAALTYLFGARRHVLVTEASQPALHALVDTVAARLGVGRPRRVRLVADAEVVAHMSIGRRELRIGQGLLPCVTEPELAALIGAELSLLGQRRARRALWMRAVWVAAGKRMYDADHTPKDVARWRFLAPFGASVMTGADRAAVAAGGSVDVAARAVLIADIADLEHSTYVSDCQPRATGWRRYAILDLDDGWLRRLENGIPNELWDKFTAEELAPLHPGLAGTLADLVPPLHLTRAVGAVRIAPLPEKQRRRLVRDMYGFDLELATWITFEQAPAQWWINRAAADAAPVWAGAARWEDGPVTDEVALVESVARDAGRLDPSEPTSAEFINEVLEVVRPVIEHALLDRGWRLKHPAVRGVLIGPAGTLVDRDRLVDAINDPTLLRGWLSER